MATTPTITMKLWTGRSDDKTCPICRPLIGKTAPMGMSFDGEHWNPPAHPGCRCQVELITRPADQQG
jgi:hypothetical protein